jgi:hypothetical protein
VDAVHVAEKVYEDKIDSRLRCQLYCRCGTSRPARKGDWWRVVSGTC